MQRQMKEEPKTQADAVRQDETFDYTQIKHTDWATRWGEIFLARFWSSNHPENIEATIKSHSRSRARHGHARDPRKIFLLTCTVDGRPMVLCGMSKFSFLHSTLKEKLIHYINEINRNKLPNDPEFVLMQGDVRLIREWLNVTLDNELAHESVCQVLLGLYLQGHHIQLMGYEMFEFYPFNRDPSRDAVDVIRPSGHEPLIDYSAINHALHIFPMTSDRSELHANIGQINAFIQNLLLMQRDPAWLPRHDFSLEPFFATTTSLSGHRPPRLSPHLAAFPEAGMSAPIAADEQAPQRGHSPAVVSRDKWGRDEDEQARELAELEAERDRQNQQERELDRFFRERDRQRDHERERERERIREREAVHERARSPLRAREEERVAPVVGPDQADFQRQVHLQAQVMAVDMLSRLFAMAPQPGMGMFGMFPPLQPADQRVAATSHAHAGESASHSRRHRSRSRDRDHRGRDDHHRHPHPREDNRDRDDHHHRDRREERAFRR